MNRTNNKNKGIHISESFNLFNFNRAEVGTPKIDEVFGKEGWIKLGAGNDYPQEILRLYQNADGLHSALIKRKVDMIAGLGWQDNAVLNNFILNTYSKEDLNKIAYKTAFDEVLFGGYYLNLVWDAQGKSIAKISHVPFEKVRIGIPTRQDGEVSEYYISTDWKKYKKEEHKPQVICAFDAADTQEALRKRIESPSQLLFCRIYSPGMDYYCLPSYHSIINWLKLSYEVSTYQLKSTQNAYMPGLIVSIPHLPPADEREATANEIKARSGTDEAGKTIVVYGQDKDSMPEFTVMQPSTNDQKFRDLIQQINEEIYIGHNANNVIAGVAVAGKLANTSEVKEQFGTFQQTVISPLQGELEHTFNLIASINGLPGELRLKQYSPSIDIVEDKESNLIVAAINSLSPLVANKVLEKMTDEEIRGIIGLPPANVSSGSTQQTIITEQ